MDPLSRLHLTGLRAVEAVGRLGTLARAAESLGVTPGAVSQHVLRAERQLGRTLFERTPKGLVPTAFGTDVLERLSPGFRLLEAAAALGRPRPDDGLAVTVPPNFAVNWLVPRLSAFTAARPDLALRIEASGEMIDFATGAFDVGIRVGDGAWSGVRADKLLDLLVFPVCAPALAARLQTPADLASVPTVVDRNSRYGWDAWLAPMGLGEDLLKQGAVFSDSALCLEAVARGHGVMLAWQTLAADALAAGRVVSPFPRLAPSGHAYWFVSSRERTPRPVEVAFRRWIAGTLAPLAREPFEAGLAAGLAASRTR